MFTVLKLTKVHTLCTDTNYLRTACRLFVSTFAKCSLSSKIPQSRLNWRDLLWVRNWNYCFSALLLRPCQAKKTCSFYVQWGNDGIFWRKLAPRNISILVNSGKISFLKACQQKSRTFLKGGRNQSGCCFVINVTVFNS